jgi:hypothetical protein
VCPAPRESAGCQQIGSEEEDDGGATLGSVRRPPLLGNGRRKGPVEGAPRLLLQIGGGGVNTESRTKVTSPLDQGWPRAGLGRAGPMRDPVAK